MYSRPPENKKRGNDHERDDNEKFSAFSSKLKLQAKHLLRIDEQASCLKAVELYREAARIDPTDAEAWAGIGSALLSYNDKGICFPNRLEEITEIKHAAIKALEIDDKEPTALTILGNIAVQEHWDFVKAEELYKKALELLPNNTRTLRDYAELCIMTGRHEEARKLSEIINGLDPVNHHNFKISFWLYLVLREFQKAEDVVRQQFLLYPAAPLEKILHGHIQLIRGNVDAAIEYFSEVDRSEELPLYWEYALLVGISSANAFKGNISAAHKTIELLRMSRAGSVYPYVPIAQIYTCLGDFDSTLKWIETAVEAHDPGLFFLAVNPIYVPLNRDPRFAEALQPTHIILVKK